MLLILGLLFIAGNKYKFNVRKPSVFACGKSSSPPMGGKILLFRRIAVLYPITTNYNQPVAAVIDRHFANYLK